MACAAAQAQTVVNVNADAFHDLATTDDGAQTYFVSELRMKGTDQTLRSKIFIYADARVAVFRQVPSRLIFQTLSVSGPSVSGDGQIVAYEVRACATANCTVATEVLTSNGPLDVVTFGSIHVSGNKRYLLTGYREIHPVLLDLTTRERKSLGDYVVMDPSVTDDGGVLVRRRSDGALLLWRDDRTTPIATRFFPNAARVNRLATKVAYERTKGEHELRVVDLISGTDMRVATAGPAPQIPVTSPDNLLETVSYMSPSLSKDGRLIAYRATEMPLGPLKVFLSATDGSSRRKLLDEALDEVVITGFGNYVYAAGTKLVRIAVDSSSVTELIPATPNFMPGFTLSIVPGGNVAVSGAGLDQTVAPHILVGDVPGVVLGADAGQMRFLAPWELAPGAIVQVRLVSDSPFEGSMEAHAFARLPQQFGVPVHEDWRPITDLDGVKPGEIIHMALLNLGAVVPMIQLGSTVPVGTLYRLLDPLRCTVESSAGKVDADVLFAGLMPLANDDRYQVDLRMPVALAGPMAFIDCSNTPVAHVYVSH